MDIINGQQMTRYGATGMDVPSDQEWRRVASSIRLTPKQESLFLSLKPVLYQLRLNIMRVFGPDVVEDLFGDLVPSVMLHPAIRPDSYALAHPGSFDEREIIDHIQLLTRPGELVLDPMSGSGTTLCAAYKTGRSGAGIELMEHWVEMTKKRISELTGYPFEDGRCNLFLKQGDCREVMPIVASEIIDLVIFSPPYFNILKNPSGRRAQYRQRLGLPVVYGTSPKELGRIDDYGEFMKQMTGIYSECFRILKKSRFMVVIVADIHSRGRFVPYHLDTVDAVIDAGFILRDIQVVMDHWKRRGIYGSPQGLFGNFHHHYALVFQKSQA